MALTFKSSTPEQRIVIDRASDGRQRVGRAVQSEHNPKFWNLSVEHPSGQKWPATFCGGDMEAVVALADLMNRTKSEYQQDRARGDRPPQEPYDPNRRIENMPSPIIGNSRR